MGGDNGHWDGNGREWDNGICPIPNAMGGKYINDNIYSRYCTIMIVQVNRQTVLSTA